MKATYIYVKSVLNASLIAGLIGGLMFVIIQPLFGMDTITSRLAHALAIQGEYSTTESKVLAWAVHMGVSFHYALLFFVLSRTIQTKGDFRKALLKNIAIAIALGWTTSWISPPAVAATISLLVNFGFPEALPPMNFSFDSRWVIHVLFFQICVLVAAFQAKKLEQGSGANSDSAAAPSE